MDLVVDPAGRELRGGQGAKKPPLVAFKIGIAADSFHAADLPVNVRHVRLCLYLDNHRLCAVFKQSVKFH
jgi:hypothetical protein